jgi:hypothetical protein
MNSECRTAGCHAVVSVRISWIRRFVCPYSRQAPVESSVKYLSHRWNLCAAVFHAFTLKRIQCTVHIKEKRNFAANLDDRK